MSPVEWEYLEGKRLPWPVSWPSLFARTAPLLVEIGFGNGRFLLDLAARRPDANVAGLEISQPSLRNTQRKVSARRLHNVRLVHSSAEQALWTLFAPGAISGVYINFPDPWPKPGHHARRLINPDFLDLLASRMCQGAAVDIATDIAEYAVEIAAHLEANPAFENRLAHPFVHHDETRVRTKYERIARDEGRLCHYFKWQRSGAPSPRAFAVPQELDMPHVILSPSPPIDTVAASFESATHNGEWGIIRFIGVYRDRDHHALLVDTYIDEQALTQRLALLLRQRQDGALIIGLHELGFPRATSGVHRAIQLLSEQLARRHSPMQVVSSNLVT